MTYYLIAGEASGDLHGANLMKALKKTDEKAEFRFLGGDLMMAEGGHLVKHYSDMAFMGFVEVVLNLRTILKNMKMVKQDLLQNRPDALVLIDFPGFNLKIAAFAKKNNIKVFYYISPKVWAWNQKRVLNIKKVVDHLYCILPFEVEFYRSWGMEVNYVGNPLLDEKEASVPDPEFINKHHLQGKKLIALLPGSRRQEVSAILTDMLGVVDEFPDYQFVIAGAPTFNEAYYTALMPNQKLPVLFGKTYDLLRHAEAAIVTSGTATLETALFHVPQIVVYKGNKISIAIARMVVKIRFISLVNLIMDKLVVKELIQEDCTPAIISRELNSLLNDSEYRNTMLDNYQALSEKMGTPGASQRTAELIVKALQ
ncbi:lipid-A-disaccharide synthase [Arcticibacter eurypsychrophilus]|uniref:lipid-A-disaccharide synthase n=1 Tax=Arcticibacter eurypsychrophilus TaxID=1434752 RepID=UPI00084D9F47|nr:lipid-A-disaccharide synthase [Arcticibacter eurypsychrophilus]